MDLDLFKRNWEASCRDDPLWAVLTQATRRGGRWDAAELFATGEAGMALQEPDSELRRLEREVNPLKGERE